MKEKSKHTKAVLSSGCESHPVRLPVAENHVPVSSLKVNVSSNPEGLIQFYVPQGKAMNHNFVSIPQELDT